MGESFQDYSCIQDFEVDFPQKVSLKMLNQGDYNSFIFSLSKDKVRAFKLEIMDI